VQVPLWWEKRQGFQRKAETEFGGQNETARFLVTKKDLDEFGQVPSTCNKKSFYVSF